MSDEEEEEEEEIIVFEDERVSTEMHNEEAKKIEGTVSQFSQSAKKGKASIFKVLVGYISLHSSLTSALGV